MSTGYSGMPLAKKLGIKPGFRVLALNAPDNYQELLAPIPEDLTILTDPEDDLDMIHRFSVEAKELGKQLRSDIKRLKQDGMLWISWPKKASKRPTDITEDVIRGLALPLGLVDVKVCAVDEVWSGLKLVVRLENRKPRQPRSK